LYTFVHPRRCVTKKNPLQRLRADERRLPSLAPRPLPLPTHPTHIFPAAFLLSCFLAFLLSCFTTLLPYSFTALLLYCCQQPSHSLSLALLARFPSPLIYYYFTALQFHCFTALLLPTALSFSLSSASRPLSLPTHHIRICISGASSSFAGCPPR
jgi:hypothetical protein